MQLWMSYLAFAYRTLFHFPLQKYALLPKYYSLQCMHKIAVPKDQNSWALHQWIVHGRVYFDLSTSLPSVQQKNSKSVLEFIETAQNEWDWHRCSFVEKNYQISSSVLRCIKIILQLLHNIEMFSFPSHLVPIAFQGQSQKQFRTHPAFYFKYSCY